MKTGQNSSHQTPRVVGTARLTIEDVVAIATHNVGVTLSDDARFNLSLIHI